MKKLLLITFIFCLSFNMNSQTVKDYDGNIYQTVKVGDQIWMKENLKTTHLADGLELYYSPIVCDSVYVSTYGRLYSWLNAYYFKLCPDGWHLPDSSEYNKLIDFLGGQNVAGGKMKEIGTSHWQTPNEGATNESGFSALLGGGSNGNDITYTKLGAYFWTSSSLDDKTAYHIDLKYNSDSIFKNQLGGMAGGLSVRCIQNQASKVKLFEFNDLTIYPNPFKNNIILKYSGTINSIISILTVDGKLIYTLTLKECNSNINLSSLSNGIYILRIANQQEIIQRKIIKNGL